MKKHFTNPNPEEYISFRPTDGTDARDLLAKLSDRMTIRNAEADNDELLICTIRDDIPCCDCGGLIGVINAVKEIAEVEMMRFATDSTLRSERYVPDIADGFDFERMDEDGLEAQFEETHTEMVALLDNLDDYMSLVRFDNLCIKLNNLNAMSA